MVLHLGGLWISGAALVGAFLSSILIYVLAWRDGITGFRFILIGIGISELMLSLVGFLLARAEIWDARAAMTWLVGSVGNAGTTELRVLLRRRPWRCCRWRIWRTVPCGRWSWATTRPRRSGTASS